MNSHQFEKKTQTRTQISRRETAARRRADVVKNGGRLLQLLLQPDAAEALESITKKTSESATSIISRLLIDESTSC